VVWAGGLLELTGWQACTKVSGSHTCRNGSIKCVAVSRTKGKGRQRRGNVAAEATEFWRVGRDRAQTVSRSGVQGEENQGIQPVMGAPRRYVTASARGGHKVVPEEVGR